MCQIQPVVLNLDAQNNPLGGFTKYTNNQALNLETLIILYNFLKSRTTVWSDMLLDY